MGAGVLFFEKNVIDLDNPEVTITVTDAVATNSGQAFVDYVRDRSNSSGWATTGSTDAALTEMLVEFGDEYDITDVFLLRNNFKNYALYYWNGSSWVSFGSAATNTEQDLRISHAVVTTTKMKLVINATMTTDDDKFLSQFICTNKKGQFVRGVELSNVTIGQMKRTVKTLSGRAKIQRSVGAVSISTKDNNVVVDADLQIVESLYESINGFLVWLCGDDTTQFVTQRIGYRRQDIYLMNITNEYTPTWEKGMYKHGTPINIVLTEVI